MSYARIIAYLQLDNEVITDNLAINGSSIRKTT